MKVVVFLLLVAMVTVHDAQPRKKASATLGQRRRAYRVQHLVNKHLASDKKRFIPSPVAFVLGLAKKHALVEKKASIRSLEKMRQRTERRALGEKLRGLLYDRDSDGCDLETSFKCDVNTTEQCHQKAYKCDGYQDCSDNTDETNCEEFDCGTERVNCQPVWYNSVMCLESYMKCDDYIDCLDGKDEDGCPGSGDDEQADDPMPTKRLVELLKALLRDE